MMRMGLMMVRKLSAIIRLMPVLQHQILFVILCLGLPDGTAVICPSSQLFARLPWWIPRAELLIGIARLCNDNKARGGADHQLVQTRGSRCGRSLKARRFQSTRKRVPGPG